jgi:hypothetical protein
VTGGVTDSIARGIWRFEDIITSRSGGRTSGGFGRYMNRFEDYEGVYFCTRKV